MEAFAKVKQLESFVSDKYWVNEIGEFFAEKNKGEEGIEIGLNSSDKAWTKFIENCDGMCKGYDFIENRDTSNEIKNNTKDDCDYEAITINDKTLINGA